MQKRSYAHLDLRFNLLVLPAKYEDVNEFVIDDTFTTFWHSSMLSRHKLALIGFLG